MIILISLLHRALIMTLTNYIKVKDTLFVTAEDLHNNAISKRNEAVEISSKAM